WTEATLGELLGAIDTPQEALLTAVCGGYLVDCTSGMDGAREVPGGWEVTVRRLVSDCPYTVAGYRLAVSSSGEVALIEETWREESMACAGRRPAGLVPDRAPRRGSRLGRYLASMARLEASAVIEFGILEQELRALGAPRRLLGEVRAARADEVRHAQVIGELACAHGARVRPPRVAARPLRDPRTLAIDNAVEGCVRETYGAVVALHQATHAADRDVGSAMEGIARDELRHAAVSWRIGAWLDGRLDRRDRAAVRRARRDAARQLEIEASAPLHAELAMGAGLPRPEVARALVRTLARDLWA
ncbi:MAG: ferritin-like domain-containing protein, partial [Deltaproteobacteria bacterium]|nr:ferritin-like domain-containing protein [Deltaproteobacteria bacterium]